MIEEFGKPYFVKPEPGEFADAFFRLSERDKLKDQIAHALERRAWFPVHEVKLKAGGVYIARRVYLRGNNPPAKDEVLAPALALWKDTGGWLALSGGFEPEQITVCHMGCKSIQVLGKTPLFWAKTCRINIQKRH